MKSKIEFTKADERSFDGTAADRYSADEVEKNIHRGEEGMQIEMDVMVTCSECDGTGKVYYSCCGDDVKGTLYEDYGICPTCKEHLSGEHEDCESCNGTGTELVV